MLVDAGKRVAPVSPQLTGSNIDQWFDQAHGLWDPVTGAPDPDVVAKTRRAGIGKVRFPGGTPANLYDWKKGVGPLDERGCQPDGRPNGGGGSLDSGYGPDEFMTYASEAGADPVIMTPMVNQTAADAADWVEYMNARVGTNPRGGTAWAELRKANGHPEPYGVKHWEIGNEPDRGGQNYWRSTDPATGLRQYAFGGSQAQEGQRLARGCDRRVSASRSDGRAGQRLEVFYPPVAPDSQTVYVNGVAWSEVDDLAGAAAGDRVYTFDAASGEIRFGDGTHGAVPPDGAPLTADYLTAQKPGFVDFYAEMKRVDPSIDVCASWAPITAESGLDGTSFPELMASEGRAGQYDCVVIHPYTNFARDFEDRDWETAREGHDEHMLGEAHAAGLVSDLQAEVAKHNADGYVAITEFGALWFGGMGDISGYPTPSWQTGMSHATYMASQWARYSQLGVPWALGNTLISEESDGLRAVLGGAPAFVFTSDATVREQLKPVLRAGGSVVSATVRENPQVSPVEPEPEYGDYDALVGSAMLGEDGQLRLIVVNRHPDQAVEARVVPAGFRHAGEVSVSTVAGDDFTSYNSIEHPNDVRIERSVVSAGSTAFGYRFPAHSVTILDLSPAP
ncbi:MAG: hypothetical protein ACRDUA_00070 [Micromonosporaceae bacterium]